MTREELLECIETANKTPVEVVDMWTNMVYTVYPTFSSDMLLAAKRVANTFSCLDLDIDVDETSIWFHTSDLEVTIKIAGDRIMFMVVADYSNTADLMSFSKISLTELLETKEG